MALYLEQKFKTHRIKIPKLDLLPVVENVKKKHEKSVITNLTKLKADKSVLV